MVDRRAAGGIAQADKVGDADRGEPVFEVLERTAIGPPNQQAADAEVLRGCNARTPPRAELFRAAAVVAEPKFVELGAAERMQVLYAHALIAGGRRAPEIRVDA